ncbi:glycosyltransferase family 87 protein [Cupriavidus sp. Agwp_2]|uniref:glycosyltransferase family 87 protein n=1 Tax=Cupriavidus sp. Agwp_2 TaxID=2897324 RepID=UPI00345F3C75
MQAARFGPRRQLFGTDAGHWLNMPRVRLYACVALTSYVLCLSIWTVRACVLQVPGVFPPGGDFVVFWSAAKLALGWGGGAPYDYALLKQVEQAAVPALAVGDGVLPWLYPPTFLLFVLPLGLLPYGLATFLFMAGGASWYAWVTCRMLPREIWVAGIAFPGMAVVLLTGQNALWLAGCAGLALTSLRTRPVLAGVLMGLVTVKPHLALMFPVALICARNWRALGAMASTALGLSLISLLAFGTEPFVEFLQNAGAARAELERGAALLTRMPTVFAATTMLSGRLPWSYALHCSVAAVALAAVIYAWARPCSFALRAAVLVCAGLLVPPYLYDYDLAFLGLAICWLGMHGYRNGWLRGERELLVVLWLLPLCGMSLCSWIGFQPMPIGLLSGLALGVWRIWQERAGKASRDA